MSEEFIEPSQPGPKASAPAIFALKSALTVVVALWVLDVQGKLGFAFYNEQFLLVVLGLWLGTKAYFEVAMLIGLLGFVGTAVLAKFVLRGDIVE